MDLCSSVLHFLRIATHQNIVDDYYSLHFFQPLNNKLLHKLLLCEYETTRQFWLPNMLKLWVKILYQLAKKTMVHQQ